jgi:hypothetical protein
MFAMENPRDASGAKQPEVQIATTKSSFCAGSLVQLDTGQTDRNEQDNKLDLP